MSNKVQFEWRKEVLSNVSFLFCIWKVFFIFCLVFIEKKKVYDWNHFFQNEFFTTKLKQTFHFLTTMSYDAKTSFSNYRRHHNDKSIDDEMLRVVHKSNQVNKEIQWNV